MVAPPDLGKASRIHWVDSYRVSIAGHPLAAKKGLEAAQAEKRHVRAFHLKESDSTADALRRRRTQDIEI